MSPKKLLRELAAQIAQVGKVGEIEMTSGNITREGDLIEGVIPTFTTDLCEVGVYDDVLYLTYICESKSYSKELFDVIENKPHFMIYGLEDFENMWYPARGVRTHEDLQEAVKKEKYMQIEVNFSLSGATVESLYNAYVQTAESLRQARIAVINQLEKDMTKEENRA